MKNFSQFGTLLTREESKKIRGGERCTAFSCGCGGGGFSACVTSMGQLYDLIGGICGGEATCDRIPDDV